jgi:hypothetical protein
MKKIFFTTFGVVMYFWSVAQSTTQQNNQIGNQSRYLGWENNFGLRIATNNQTRMWLNSDGTFASGVNTSGFIGIGTTNPIAPLHIIGSQQQNTQGWTRGLTLSNNAALQWDGGTLPGFFMAHPSGNPLGNWYAGVNAGNSPSAEVEYAFTVACLTPFGLNPLASTKFLKNVLVTEDGFGRRLGVNVLNPTYASEIYSNATQMRLSYGSAVNTTTSTNTWTDFLTNSFGNLQIDASGNRVGIETAGNPGNTLHVNSLLFSATTVNGFPQAAGFATPTGTSGVRFSDLTSASTPQLNPSLGVLSVDANGDVILVPGGGTANNGLTVVAGVLQLGTPCITTLTAFNATALTANRVVPNRNFNLWFGSLNSETGGIGVGGQANINSFCNTGNTFEISANSKNAQYGSANASGLRFTKLTSTSPVIANTLNGVDASKVLTVDGDGDVVLVNAATSLVNNGIYNNGGLLQLGAPCNNPTAISASATTESRTVFLDQNNSFWFATLTGSTGGIGLGAQPASTPFCSVGNTVEISANNASSYGNTNSSGLRFSRLLATSPVIANTVNGVDASKVLTVDGNGDVVLVSAASGLGNNCSQASNPLLENYAINLNSNNLYLPSDNAYTDKVVIGDLCGSVKKGKVNIQTSVSTDATNNESSVLYLENLHPTINGNNFGLNTRAVAGLGNVYQQHGIKSYAQGGREARGITADAVVLSGNGSAYGGIFNAGTIGVSNATNVGVFGGAAGGYFQNIGVYGSTNYIGAGVNYAGYFAGDLVVNGPSTGGANLVFSDSSIKTNVISINRSLELIHKLRPVTYDFNNSYAPQLNLNSHKNYGFISQEVALILPDLVESKTILAKNDDLGNEIFPAKTVKVLNYDGLIPLAINSIQELDNKVNKVTLSDQSLKINVTNLNNSLAKTLAMRGVNFKWNQANTGFDTRNHVGFIAQEINAIDPLLTFKDSDSLMHVEYDKVVPVLAEAIQELNATVVSKDSIINALNARLTNLENCLSSILPALCQMNQSMIQNNTPAAQEELRMQLSVTLSNKAAIILDQNVPNPFAEQTTINFSIPTTVAKAQIHFYNLEGKLMQSVDVLERGLGSVTVFGSDLSSGTYTYTLVADGKVVSTKKMIKQ